LIDAAVLWGVGLRNIIPNGVTGLTKEIIAHLVECRVKRVVLMLDRDSLAKVGKYECHFCPDVLGIARSRTRDFSECLEQNVVTKVGEYLIATKGIHVKLD